MYPQELYTEKSREGRTADALDAAVRGFFVDSQPVEDLPILQNKRAQKILRYCISRMVDLDIPEPYAHIQRLERALNVSPAAPAIPLQQPPRLRAVR
jgi:hypothetical protein